ncbi:MAG TPA: hypothetical protein VGT41_00305 [Candidatus Babeliales bacterium]|nr:hypothetical protein [Candidatus Babeliales bacterium]
MKLLKILLSVAVMSAACVPHVLYAAHSKEDLEARQEIRRLQRLGEFQQARAGEDAAARREAVEKTEPLDTSLVTDFGLDEPEMQQAITESLRPQKKPARKKN